MGRTLEEIDLIFRESPSVWATVRFAKKGSQGIQVEQTQTKHEVEHEEYSDK